MHSVAAIIEVVATFGMATGKIRWNKGLFSRLVIRLTGSLQRAQIARIGSGLAMVSAMLGSLLAHGRGSDALWTIVAVWFGWAIDDWVTGDDDRWRRWRDRAANRLRKLAPSRLRPVQRWAPSL